MAWHKDKQIAADLGIFSTLFPEQTKTPTQIVIWSIVLLADIIGCVACAFSWGIIGSTKWMIALVLIAAVVLFWLEGVVYGAIAILSKKK